MLSRPEWDSSIAFPYIQTTCLKETIYFHQCGELTFESTVMSKAVPMNNELGRFFIEIVGVYLGNLDRSNLYSNLTVNH
jgi:hypothetical protein